MKGTWLRNIDGSSLTGSTQTLRNWELEAALKVCKICLNEINYDNYRIKKPQRKKYLE